MSPVTLYFTESVVCTFVSLQTVLILLLEVTHFGAMNGSSGYEWLGKVLFRTIATHLVYYFQFIKQQRSVLPESARIPTTNLYLKCYAITHGERRRRKSDPLIIPEEYKFLESPETL